MLQAAPGPQTAGTVVIIAILSVLLAVLLAALLTLLIFTWYVDRVETPLGGWGEGGIPDLGRLFPFPRSRPPTLLPITSSAGEVFPEGQRGVTFIDQGIPSVLEPVCVLVGALTPASLVPLPARHPLMGGAGGWGQIF